MQEIENWLRSNRPYEAGVKLYQRYGKDPLLQLLFAEAHSEFKEAKLTEALEALVHGAGDAPESDSEICDEAKDEHDQTSAETETAPPVATGAPRGWPADMDNNVKALYDEWLPLFKERKDLQARITDVALMGEQDPEKEKEAGAMAHRILDLRDQCQAIYRKRDAYLQTGKLPAAPAAFDLEVPTDPRKQPAALANWQRYLRDYKAKLKAAPADENYRHQVARYEWGIAELKKRMGDAL